MIVDDEIFFLEAIDEILTEGGFETVRADTGETAIELADQVEAYRDDIRSKGELKEKASRPPPRSPSCSLLVLVLLSLHVVHVAL